MEALWSISGGINLYEENHRTEKDRMPEKTSEEQKELV